MILVAVVVALAVAAVVLFVVLYCRPALAFRVQDLVVGGLPEPGEAEYRPRELTRTGGHRED